MSKEPSSMGVATGADSFAELFKASEGRNHRDNRVKRTLLPLAVSHGPLYDQAITLRDSGFTDESYQAFSDIARNPHEKNSRIKWFAHVNLIGICADYFREAEDVSERVQYAEQTREWYKNLKRTFFKGPPQGEFYVAIGMGQFLIDYQRVLDEPEKKDEMLFEAHRIVESVGQQTADDSRFAFKYHSTLHEIESELVKSPTLSYREKTGVTEQLYDNAAALLNLGLDPELKLSYLHSLSKSALRLHRSEEDQKQKDAFLTDAYQAIAAYIQLANVLGREMQPSFRRLVIDLQKSFAWYGKGEVNNFFLRS